jgi:DNA-binding Xre family transcriptional regulator
MNDSKQVCYKKLWKLLIDRDMKKKDLCVLAHISPASITKMGRNGHVTTDILSRICLALNCGIGDVLEIVPSRQRNKELKKDEGDV